VLRKISKQLKVSKAMHLFAQNLLQASMLGLQIISKELQDTKKQKELCCFFLEQNIEKPTIDVACGSVNVFGSDFNSIIKEQHDLRLGLRVDGLPYELNSLPENKFAYLFKYMNFHTNKQCSTSISQEIHTVDTWPYDVIKSADYMQIVTSIVLHYIFVTIRYNEQLYRSAFMDKLVYNCAKQTDRIRNQFFKARSAFITQQLILQNNNSKNSFGI
jgi:hypothetical protein